MMLGVSKKGGQSEELDTRSLFISSKLDIVSGFNNIDRF
jgi:hypothetical protein